MNRHSSWLLWPVGLLTTLMGCAQPVVPAGDASTPLPMQVLRRERQCNSFTQPAVVWLDETLKLAQLYRRFAELPPAVPPAVDFSRYGVLLISMGRRPTAGYGLNVTAEAARLQGDTLQVTVVWQEPAADSVQAQMLTEPCLLLQLPAVPFQRIQVLDQAGQVRVDGGR